MVALRQGAPVGRRRSRCALDAVGLGSLSPPPAAQTERSVDSQDHSQDAALVAQFGTRTGRSPTLGIAPDRTSFIHIASLSRQATV